MSILQAKLAAHGRGIGFHRVRAYLERHHLDLPALASRSVIVTGSNGKGSTAQFITAGLEKMGYSVARFISPHLFDINERFYAHGQYIDQHTLEQLLEKGHAHSAWLKRQYDDPLGEFELFFLVAAEWFIAQNTDYIVWEAGIGGRYDVTRMVGARLSALCAVEREHCDLLGKSLEGIAFDKLDAVRDGGQVVISDMVDESLSSRISAYGWARGLDMHFIAQHYTHITTQQDYTAQQYYYQYAGKPYRGRLDMLGRHQLSNALCASECISRMTNTPAPKVMPLLQACQWPGRLQCLTDQPSIWLDGGHTPNAVRWAVQTLSPLLPRYQTVVVWGMSPDKEHAAVAEIIQQFFDCFIITQSKIKSTPAHKLEQYIDTNNSVSVTSTIAEAYAKAETLRQTAGKNILVLGGLYLVAEYAMQHDKMRS